MVGKEGKKLGSRGELTSQQIVVIIIAIIGLIVVLFFVSLIFDDSGEVDRELCRLSVLTRATAPDVVQASVPLKCTTEKICITSKIFGGKCKEFQGEDNVVSIKLKGTDDEKARQIEKTIADSMYYCYSIMGKGKLDLFANAKEQIVGSSGTPTCVVCSRVALADDISPSILSNVNVDSYLQDNFVPGAGNNLGYIEAFTDRGASIFPSTSGVNLKDISQIEVAERKGAATSLQTLNTNRQVAIVFSQVKTVEVGTVLTNLLGLAVGATAVVPGSLKVGRALFFTKAAVVTLPIVGIGVGSIIWNTLNGRSAAALYCGTLISAAVKSGLSEAENEKLREGCSIVQVVPYSVQNVNGVCPGSIQSIP